MLQVQYRVLSRPATVWWAGFRSDTLRLQQEGWEIAAEEDVHYGRIRLMLRHREMKLYALTNETRYEYQRMHDERDAPLEFHVVMAAPNIQVRQLATDGLAAFDNFRQIDAKPQLCTETVKNIEDFKIFATPLVRTEELIVEPETVAAMLEKIRTMQAPEQARIRAKNRLAESGLGRGYDEQPRQTFHAQIISIADRGRKVA